MHNQNIYLVHTQNKLKEFRSFASQLNGVVWETCFRQVAFFTQPLKSHPSLLKKKFHHLEFFQEKEAYKWLLEVLCGLHSPILGETEVFGQFKAWIKKETSKELEPLKDFWEPLLRDVKNIRTHYLKGVGNYSYGSVLRQESLPFSYVEILGSGFLVEKILPWFQSFSVVLHCRNSKRGENLKRKFSKQSIEIKELPFKKRYKNSLVIIAISVPSQQLEEWFQTQPLSFVFDLRSEIEKESPLTLNCPIQTLEDILKKSQSLQKEARPQIEQTFKVIEKKSENFAQRMKNHPFGWDDLMG